MENVIWKMENEKNDNTSEFLHQCLHYLSTFDDLLHKSVAEA